MTGTLPFGQLLRDLRQSQNHSIEAMAALVSVAAGRPVPRDQVRSWEAGTHTPDPTDLAHLAIALEVPLMLLEGALTDERRAAKRTANSVNSADDYGVSHRVRQLRNWRGLSQRVVAELAGISQEHLSMIETGHRAVTKRSLLEALATALRVSPADLTDKPWERGGLEADSTNLVGIESALDAYELGDDPGVPAREWPEVEADVQRLVGFAYVHADFARLTALIPTVLGELHALYVRDPVHRQEILLGLIKAYRAAAVPTKYLGGDSSGYTVLAAKEAERCAGLLGNPAWRGIAAFSRCWASGSINRPRQYRRAVHMAEELSPALDDPEVTQAYGMLHLSAAMAAAAQSDRDTATTHLDEAGAVADRFEPEVGTFAQAWFGRTNVGIWRTTIGLELGDGPKVAETARNVHVETIPSPMRQSNFYADLGRSLLAEKGTREKGLGLLLRAERLAPQRVRNDVFVREAVGDALRTARRAAGGAELRGLAYRMGLAPNG